METLDKVESEPNVTLPNLFRQRMRLAAGIFAAAISIFVMSAESADKNDVNHYDLQKDYLVVGADAVVLLAASALVASADYKIKIAKGIF